MDHKRKVSSIYKNKIQHNTDTNVGLRKFDQSPAIAFLTKTYSCGTAFDSVTDLSLLTCRRF